MDLQNKFKLLFTAVRRVKGRTLVFTRTKAEAVVVHRQLALAEADGGFGDASTQLIHADRNQVWDTLSAMPHLGHLLCFLQCRPQAC